MNGNHTPPWKKHAVRNTNTLSLGPDFSYFDERVYILIIMSSQEFKGYFEKRARSSGRNWKRRWFVFSPLANDNTATITYYKDEKTEQKQGKSKGKINLTSETVIGLLALKDYCFEIVPGGGEAPLIIAADNSVSYKQVLQRYGCFVHSQRVGYLMKRARHSGRNWKKRWFVLDFHDRNLYVFDSEKDAVSSKNKTLKDTAKDCIEFGDTTVVHPSGLKQFCIEILPGDGEVSLFVAALTKNDYAMWLAAFARACSEQASGRKATVLRDDSEKRELSTKGKGLLQQATGNGGVSAPSSPPMPPPMPNSSDNVVRNSLPPPRRTNGPPRRVNGSIPPPKRAAPVRKTVVKANTPPPLPTSSGRSSGSGGGSPSFLSGIQNFSKNKLKHTVTVDKSAPALKKKSPGGGGGGMADMLAARLAKRRTQLGSVSR